MANYTDKSKEDLNDILSSLIDENEELKDLSDDEDILAQIEENKKEIAIINDLLLEEGSSKEEVEEKIEDVKEDIEKSETLVELHTVSPENMTLEEIEEKEEIMKEDLDAPDNMTAEEIKEKEEIMKEDLEPDSSTTNEVFDYSEIVKKVKFGDGGVYESEKGKIRKSEKYGSEYQLYDDVLLYRPIGGSEEDWSEVDYEMAFNKEERKSFDKEMKKLFGPEIEAWYIYSSNQPSPLTEKLVDEHQKEAHKEKAKIHNLGWGQDEDNIVSKTSLGLLYSEIDEKGNITHEWEYDDEEYAKGGYLKVGNIEKRKVLNYLEKEYKGKYEVENNYIYFPNKGAMEDAFYELKSFEDISDLKVQYAKGGTIPTELKELELWKKSKIESLDAKAEQVGITSKNIDYRRALDTLNKLVDDATKVIKSGILKNGKYTYSKGFFVKSYEGEMYVEAQLTLDKKIITDMPTFQEESKKLKKEYTYGYRKDSHIARLMGEYTQEVLGFPLSKGDNYTYSNRYIGKNYAKGGLTPEEGEMVEPWMWDYIRDEISYTRKPTSIDEVSTSFDAAEVDEEVLQIISLFPRLEADNLEDLDGVLTGDTQFYVVYINEVPYLINNEGFDYPRYASRIDNLEGTEENWGLIYNPKFKGYAQYAKGGSLRRMNAPLLRYTNYEDGWRLNLVKLNPFRNQSGLRYKGNYKYGISRLGPEHKKEVWQFETLKEADKKYDELVELGKTYSKIEKKGKIEVNYAKGGELEIQGDNFDKKEVNEFVNMFNDMDEEDFTEAYENITGEDFYDEGISRKEATIQIIHELDTMDGEAYDLEMIRLGVYAKGGAIYEGHKVKIKDSGKTMKVTDVSKNKKDQVEFSGDEGTYLIGDIEKMEKGGKTLSEDELWDMIEKFGWLDYGDARLAVKDIGEKVSKLSKDEYYQLTGFIEVKLYQLYDKYEKDWLDGKIQVSDDGWSDLRAEVIGRGKDFYNNITVEKLSDMADSRDYTENFTYVLQKHKNFDDYGSSSDLIKYEEKWLKEYGIGGTLLGTLVGGYVGYKIGRARPQKKGFDTEKRIYEGAKAAYRERKSTPKKERSNSPDIQDVDFEEVDNMPKFKEGGDLSDVKIYETRSNFLSRPNNIYTVVINDSVYEINSDYTVDVEDVFIGERSDFPSDVTHWGRLIPYEKAPLTIKDKIRIKTNSSFKRGGTIKNEESVKVLEMTGMLEALKEAEKEMPGDVEITEQIKDIENMLSEAVINIKL